MVHHDHPQARQQVIKRKLDRIAVPKVFGDLYSDNKVSNFRVAKLLILVDPDRDSRDKVSNNAESNLLIVVLV